MRRASLQREAHRLLPLLAAVPLVVCAIWLLPQETAAGDDAPGSGSLPRQQAPADVPTDPDARDERA